MAQPLFLHLSSWILNRKQFCIFQEVIAAHQDHAKIQVRHICIICFIVFNAFLAMKILPLKKKKRAIFLQHTLTYFCLRDFLMQLVTNFTKSNCEVVGGPQSAYLLFLLQEICKMRVAKQLRGFFWWFWEGHMWFLDCMWVHAHSEIIDKRAVTI